jgi:hypothetical protein
MVAMTPEERTTITLIETCRKSLEEPDPVKFQRLVAELVDLLDRVAPQKEDLGSV